MSSEGAVSEVAPLSAAQPDLASPAREALGDGAEPESATPTTASVTRPVAATNIVVRDAEGRHVSDVAVGLRGRLEAGVATSGANGAFLWSAAKGHGHLVAADGRWATVLSAATRVAHDEVSTLVVAPPVDIVGRVEDWLGRPVQAAVQIRLPEDLRGRLGASLEHSRELRYVAETEADGRFALPASPAVRGAILELRVNDRLRASLPMPMSAGAETVFTLPRPDNALELPLLLGRVLDDAGQPIEGVRVHWDRCVTATTDSQGHFALHPTTACRTSALVAVKSGWGPAVHAFDLDESGVPVVSAPIVVVLPSLQTLDGVVVDEHGRPVGQCWVWLKNPVYAGLDGRGPLFAETVAEGKTHRGWDQTVTGIDGRFSLVGVAGHVYQVAALDRETFAQGEARGTAGDRSIRVVLSREGMHPLDVTVVDQSGAPVAGARVSVMLETSRINTNGPGELPREHSAWYPLVTSTTDAAGLAAFESVGGDRAKLSIEGPDIDPLDVDVTAQHFSEGRITVEVIRTAEVVLTFALPEPGDRVAFIDADGRECSVTLTHGGGGVSRTNRAPLTGGDLLLRVNVDARFAVLVRNGQKIRTPVQLAPGTLNRITL
ncbi:MAG: hypothetical protein GC161_16730 [Planctomycetaceae bacterium]|nr:hypothetical protein [Planctomycetaceae bacterium]